MVFPCCIPVDHSSPSCLNPSATGVLAGVRRDTMAWKTPKIVEIVCGAEINAYVSAEIV